MSMEMRIPTGDDGVQEECVERRPFLLFARAVLGDNFLAVGGYETKQESCKQTLR